ncbi:gamma-glutamyl phosphate reductase [Nautilia profundicola AmH]|uniref:Gamma-glutamyl phosphate reductase n=1 Tax=Nautilia profundicola (strain ATCC BAA-1463 / DSM 18972 / AmH) TaxID=598659 RepID=PROA_NAUPA|nr:glutamate-5-semialdehyde dehydrogenase [Nautilia profundicola]B9L9A2.1 RecName: Full=Gamma-glutamyl phosphate reductase; Short=GPR; AltName: Full=Glutamate-5-semialdehyde dehydrogenase; AltName: Full=Glutamyl-gamma-semialdehyde dehydrogenase; Short=GSA dehydrogenase [Nautilia profundicola AmH]ACM92254.1 gamma-glutamyl phosphate reductase [Nautilia profundicola AmH]
MKEVLRKVKDASRVTATLNGEIKRKILKEMAEALEQNSSLIINENKKDLKYANENNLSAALIDRLYLDEKRIGSMADALRDIATLKDPVGRVIDGWMLDNGLRIEKVKIPIGVIGIIYESRPNVTSDAAGLCFMSGNACILKGGKEAMYSNIAIINVLRDVLERNSLPKDAVSLLPDYSREGVYKLIQEDKYVDLIIPRGGEKLIKFVSENSKVPVVKHDKGLCHIYIHKDANIDEAVKISVNAKVQRPGVCNAVETLLVDESVKNEILPKLKAEMEKEGVELRGCEKTLEVIDINKATEEDWNTEYLDKILSIKVVRDLNEAIEHIQTYGSGHSDSIITENYSASEEFLNRVDSACVYVNASTRFTDGGEFGFGAEVGISTNKLHARGPMGIDDLTTYKYKIYGNGQIRE